MSLKKLMKGVAPGVLPADGFLTRDEDVLTPYQAACTKRFGLTLQIEQDNYLLRHPEVLAMLKVFISKMVQKNKRKGILKEAAEHFLRPAEELMREIEGINLHSRTEEKQILLTQPPYNDINLSDDIRNIVTAYYQPEPQKCRTPSVSTINTESSSFLSDMTSDTTLATPEPIPTPEPTLSEAFMNLVSNTVDKAIFLRVDDEALNYDTAYIELSKAVENAMEIPVTDIKMDIVELFNNAYEKFDFNILEKERIVAAIAWEKRMRKKMKRTLRRLNNFKGYETPPTPKSEISSHESYKIPPLRPCMCHPQFKYNRYPKVA
ncbi:uncharacterized protein LOC126780633 [Nymphalis io]|uniref:uncharacterized protein LOC126780633 n=1 Tax=Inachis io TaxID=171585 RepID=UPI00216A6EA9|nr:uncharacterized protein LOC126780633 [Nymphalis io]